MADDQNPDSFAQASQVPAGAVGLDTTEGIAGAGATPGGALDRALQIHHQQRVAHAQMYRSNAATAIGQITKGTKWDPTLNGGVGGERPLTQKEQDDLTAQKHEALQQYGKIIGVNKESKGALDKAHGIIDFILRRKQEQQGRPGGMQVPPTPQYGSTVGEGGVTMTPPPGSTPTVMDNGVTMTPPPPVRPQPSALEQSVAAPFAQHQAQVGQGLEDAQRKQTALYAMRTQEATKIGLDPNSREFKQYVATGNFPPVFRLQKLPYKDPRTGKILEGSYDTASGAIYDQEGNVVPNAEPANLASMTPKKIVYKGPNDEPLIGLQVANKLYDQGGNELPEGTQAWEGTLVPKTTTGTTQKIDPLTGKRTSLSSSKTVAPSGTKITGPGGYKAAPNQSGGMSSPPTPQAAPQGGGGGKQSAPAAPQSPQSKLSGTTGTKASQDAEREAAYLHRNNLRNVTSSTRTMIEAAPKVEDFVDKIQSQIDGLQNDLGPAKGRWNEFWAGKVGTKNPQYTALRTDVGLLSTLLMRMHVGARGGEYIMKHFEDLINQGKQDPDNLRAALKEIKDYADNVIQEGRQQGIDMAPGRPGGYSTPPSPGSPSGGFTPF